MTMRKKIVSLALQGGGSHGAFTWGVLDTLLEDGRFNFEGISGTSAGAMNAVVFAHGLLDGGRDGAREALARFWTAVANSLKARFHLHWAEVRGDQAYQSALTAAQSGISTNAGNWRTVVAGDVAALEAAVDHLAHIGIAGGSGGHSNSKKGTNPPSRSRLSPESRAGAHGPLWRAPHAAAVPPLRRRLGLGLVDHFFLP